MKKTLLLLIALTIGFGLKAQSPLSTAVDFTATDCHGTEVHLFDILDGGQYVFIDFFFAGCNPCQQATPKVVESYSAFGCNMYDVYYMEISDRDSDAVCQTWCQNYGVEYPTISGTAGGNTICDQYQLGGFPTIILIAPDHSIVLHDLWPISSAQTVIDALTPFGIEEHDCNAGGEVIVDFTGTDIDGNEINLYSILDGGQAVLINFFLFNDQFSESIMADVVQAFHDYGCNQHDVFFLEITPNGHDGDCQTWVENFHVQYPTISRDGGGNTITQAIPVAFYPTIMLIRPDHTIAQRDIYPPTLEWMTFYMNQEGIEQYPCEPNAIDDNGTTSFSLYPNPANGNVTLKGEQLGTVTVYNALGQKMDEFKAESNKLNINTSKYLNGVYFVKVNDETLRFIITH